jgi:hypothetical protein
VTFSALPGRSLFAFLQRPPVMLASPYPPAECGRRLEAATQRRPWKIAGFGRGGGLPLQGQVAPAVIRVAMREVPNNRNNLDAQFIGRIEQGPDGGTLVVGTVGPEQGMRDLFAVVPVAVVLVGGGSIAIALWSLLSGHLQLHQVLQIVVPLVVAVAYVRMLLTSPARVQREVQRLLGTLSTILDATASFPADRGYPG